MIDRASQQSYTEKLKHRAYQSATSIKKTADNTRKRALQEVKDHMVPDEPLAPLGTSANPSNRIYTLANAITFTRLILTIAFLVLFVMRTMRLLALACYIVAAVTDFLDGQVARRTQTVTWLGKISDPIMDRILLATGVIGLAVVEEIPFWIAIFVIVRDGIMAVGALVLQTKQKRPLDVCYIGKIATACLMFGFCDMLIGYPYLRGLGVVSASYLPGLNCTSVPLGMFAIYLGCIASILAAATYIYRGLAILTRPQAMRESRT